MKTIRSGGNTMLKKIAVLAAAVILALAVLGLGFAPKPASMAGSWQVDSRHSAAQLITDGTTDYGKTKTDFTLGFGRVNGNMKIDDTDPAKSNIVFAFYPASAMSPIIAEDGKFLSEWLSNQANNTLVCFHSKTVQRTADGKLQATGELAVTRVDRNVDATPSEAYSGPVYGPPMIHRVAREATFTFDFPPADGKEQKDGGTLASASYNLSRENFPQLVKAVVATYWPPVVEDENCQAPSGVSEDYRGFRCTGMFMEAAGLPPAPGVAGEDYSGTASNFNAVVGNHLNIMLHMRLMAKASGERAAGGK
jgi:polyisoprenoid-binding protein YceI